MPLVKKSSALKHFLHGNLTPPKMDAGCRVWQTCFHHRSSLAEKCPQMNSLWCPWWPIETLLYSIIAPKWMQSITDMFSELKPVCLEAEMHPKWVPCGKDCLSSQCWIPFIVETKCPPNRCFLCQSCFLTLFCLTSCPSHGCFLCERCCQLRFSVVTEVFNVKPFFWLGQSAPKMDAFSTDVLNVTLQNTPDMVSFMTEVVNVNPFFG